MTVADKLTAIADAKTAIVTAVQARGGDLVDDPPIALIAPAIDALPENGGGETGVVGVFKTAIYIDLGVKVIDFGGASGMIRNYFAYYSSVEELRGTQNVTSIENSAFNGCSSLTSVSFPSATSIGTTVFNGCSSLTSVSFPSATSIGNSAFYGCSSLTSVSFPSATSIVLSAFNGCSSLTNANFPSATSIGTTVFYACSSLEVVFIGTEQTTVATLSNTNAFLNTPDTMRIVVPDTLVDAYKTANNWATYADRIIGITEWEATQ